MSTKLIKTLSTIRSLPANLRGNPSEGRESNTTRNSFGIPVARESTRFTEKEGNKFENSIHDLLNIFSRNNQPALRALSLPKPTISRNVTTPWEIRLLSRSDYKPLLRHVKVALTYEPQNDFRNINIWQPDRLNVASIQLIQKQLLNTAARGAWKYLDEIAHSGDKYLQTSLDNEVADLKPLEKQAKTLRLRRRLERRQKLNQLTSQALHNFQTAVYALPGAFSNKHQTALQKHHAVYLNSQNTKQLAKPVGELFKEFMQQYDNAHALFTRPTPDLIIRHMAETNNNPNALRAFEGILKVIKYLEKEYLK